VSRDKYVPALILVVALLAVAVQAYYVNRFAAERTSVLSSPPLTVGAPSEINYPNPLRQNVTLSGVMSSFVVSPACALSNPPCAIVDSSIYYITVKGWNYRLIFPNSTALPMNGAHIVVTGTFVTPSTFEPGLWTPQIYFHGDIYVHTYYYVFPY